MDKDPAQPATAQATASGGNNDFTSFVSNPKQHLASKYQGQLLSLAYGVVTVSLVSFVWAIVTLSTVCGAIVLIAIGDLVAMIFAIQGNLAYYASKFNLIWFGIEAIFIAITCIRAAWCGFNVVWAFIDIGLWVGLLLTRGYYYLAIRKATAVAQS